MAVSVVATVPGVVLATYNFLEPLVGPSRDLVCALLIRRTHAIHNSQTHTDPLELYHYLPRLWSLLPRSPIYIDSTSLLRVMAFPVHRRILYACGQIYH